MCNKNDVFIDIKTSRIRIFISFNSMNGMNGNLLVHAQYQPVEFKHIGTCCRSHKQKDWF